MTPNRTNVLLDDKQPPHHIDDIILKRKPLLSILCLIWIGFISFTIYSLEQQVSHPTSPILNLSLTERIAQACISIFSAVNGIILTYLGFETALYVLRWPSLSPKSIRAYFRIHDKDWSNPFATIRLLISPQESSSEVGIWFFLLMTLYFVGMTASLLLGNAYILDVCLISSPQTIIVSGPSIDGYSALQTYDVISYAQGVMATSSDPKVTYNLSYYRSASNQPNFTSFWGGYVSSNAIAENVFGLMHDVSCSEINNTEFVRRESSNGYILRTRADPNLFNLRLDLTVLLYSISSGFNSNNSMIRGIPVSEDLFFSVNETIDGTRSEPRAYQCHAETRAGFATVDGTNRSFSNFKQSALKEHFGEPVDSPTVAFALALDAGYNSTNRFINTLKFMTPLGYRVRSRREQELYYTSVPALEQVKRLEQVLTAVGAASIANNPVAYTTTGRVVSPVTCRKGNRGSQIFFIMMASLEIVWLAIIAFLFVCYPVYGKRLDAYQMARFLSIHGDNFDDFKRTLVQKDA